MALPGAQQVMLGVAAVVVLFVALASIWQSAGTQQRNRVVRNLRSSLDGVRKMSKSYNNTIEVFEPFKAMRKKVMRIATDSRPMEQSKEPAGAAA